MITKRVIGTETMIIAFSNMISSSKLHDYDYRSEMLFLGMEELQNALF